MTENDTKGSGKVRNMDRKSNDSAWSNASQSDIWGQTRRNTEMRGKRETWKIVISREDGGALPHTGERELDVVESPLSVRCFAC